MINDIVFLEDHHGFAKKSLIIFRPGVNLVVGDQGCGKSTLLCQIMAYNIRGFSAQEAKHPRIGKPVVFCTGTPGTKIAYFDFEKDNPRIQPAFDMSHFYDTQFQIGSNFASHGQAIRPFLDLIEHVGSNTLLLDEPDMALSVRSILQLIKSLKTVTAKGQVILSAHNETLIKAFPEVLSLEHSKWMTSKDFLKSQKTDPAPTFSSKRPRLVQVGP